MSLEKKLLEKMPKLDRVTQYGSYKEGYLDGIGYAVKELHEVADKIQELFDSYYQRNKTTRDFDELYQDVLALLVSQEPEKKEANV